MRITENANSEMLLTNLHKVGVRRLDLLQKLSTGKRVEKASDDPDGVQLILRYQKNLKQTERYLSNVSEAKIWLNETEFALTSIGDQLSLAIEKTLQASNDTLGSDERDALAQDIQSILESVVHDANGKSGDYYIFGGTNVSGAPFALGKSVEEETFTAKLGEAVDLDHTDLSDAAVTVTSTDGLTTFVEGVDFEVDRTKGRITTLAGGGMANGTDYYISYDTISATVLSINEKGTSGDVQREISKGELMKINVSGEEVFVDKANTLQALIDLKNALLRDDGSRIRALNEDLNKAHDQVIYFTSLTGMRYERLNSVEDELENVKLNITSMKSEVEDADMAELAVDFEKEETLYDAILKAGARLVQQNLLDYLS
jgi:flagellar hook-associated protein 3